MDDSGLHPLLACYVARRDELVRYFRARLRSEEAAQDLVQDLYLKIATPPAEEILNPGAYLYRLANNLMLDRLKQQKRSVSRDGAWRGLNTTMVGSEDVTEQAPADEVLAARQRLKLILDVVNGLPPAHRQAFRLHKLEGKSHAETAAAMGVSRSSVEKYIMTCLAAILAKAGK